uniref:NADH dehydrogenase subunit 6 n=1 Tax=Sirsoe methanicola TaxID=378374 RepID=UPI00203728AB|nr:NADH dehydrogenase subunit 6 [Sirsoe methanicola]UQV94835.1 NADH dehydrogenase subunit 6 [Sirsoe methanicola]
MSFLTLAISLALLNSYTPLTLGLWIMSLALTSSMLASAASYSWFGLMMFLIYIGGMLVMFAYFMAIQPNQQLNITPSFLTLLLTLMIAPWILRTPHLSHSIIEQPTWVTTLMSMYNIPSLMILGLVLFLTLLAVVKISSSFMGPLRPYNYV